MLKQHSTQKVRQAPVFIKSVMHDINADEILNSLEYISTMRQISAEDMTVARYMMAADGILMLFLATFLLVIYYDNGFVPYSFLRFTIITLIVLTVHGVFTWRNTSRFYAKYHQR